MDSHWVAWAAGIVDGEGAVTLSYNRSSAHKPSGQITLGVRVQMSDEAAVRRLALIFGGSVRRYAPPKTAWRLQFIWGVYSQRAYDTLKAMRPWLVTKGALADLGFEFWETCAKPVGWNTQRPSGRAARLTEVERARRLDLWRRFGTLQIKGQSLRKQA